MAVLDGSEQVASLTGSSSDVEAGSTASVDFISTDEYSEGDYTYDFQVDASFEGTSAAESPMSGESGSSSGTGLSDGDWTVESVNVEDDGLGDFGAAARITNTSSGSLSAIYTLAVLDGSEQVAPLTGSSSDVEAGSTASVDFISTDEYSAGDYTYDFQVEQFLGFAPDKLTFSFA